MTGDPKQRRTSWENFLRMDADLSESDTVIAAIQAVELQDAVEELLSTLQNGTTSGRDPGAVLGDVYAQVFHINYHHNELVKALNLDPD